MGFRDVCPRPARSWCEGSSIRVPSPLVTTRHGRAARVGAAATAAATRGAGVAGEPLRRVDAPTPLLLRSPPLAKVQSHSHHLLRQVLFAYLAVPPCLVELVVIAILHHSLLHCVVHNPCHPIPRLSVGKFELGVIPGSRRRRPRRFGRRRGGGGRARRCALGAPTGARRASAQCAQPVLVHHLGRRGWGSTSLGCGLAQVYAAFYV